jgi:pseudouridine kinase
MSNKTLIIGAINIDILAFSKNELIQEDSNLANITFCFGGVGGNIATNLAHLGIETHMLTTIGDDYFSDLITQRYKELDIALKCQKIANTNSNIYLAVLDKKDLYVGLNDMSLTKYIDKSFIQKHEAYINQFTTVIVDNNLPEDALTELISVMKDQTLIVDAVSMTKAPKLKSILHRIDYLKLNSLELDILTKSTTIEEQLKEMSDAGVRALIVTNKEEDIVFYKNKTVYKTKVLKTDNIVSTSGCGDAFISGVAYGVINHKTDHQSLEYGKQLAQQTLLVKESINEKVKIND